MKPQAAMRWARAAWDIAGPAAPRLMSRYARMTALNRTSRDRIIRRAPEILTSPVPAGDADGDVVVPVYNNFPDTSALLQALADDAAFTGKIILVHDCSTDARLGPLLKSFAQKDARAQLLENDKNAGFVRTCNRGIMASRRDVVILNTDIVLPRGAIHRILRRLQSGPRIASVTPLSNCAYGVGLPDLLYDNPMPYGASVGEIDVAVQSLPPVADIELPSGIGFCMGMSRAAIDALGPFDEAFGLGYGEETDFCMRAVKAGYHHVLGSDCYVGHKGGQSFGTSWQDLARKGTLKVLHRHPVFLNRIAEYLDAGETRALGLAILVRLAESQSGCTVAIQHTAPPDGSDAATPQLFVQNGAEARAATLCWQGQRYTYPFTQETVLQQTLALAKAR